MADRQESNTVSVCSTDSGGSINLTSNRTPRRNPSQTLLNVCTYNCRTLSNEAKLRELESELELINWDVIGLSEVRRKGEDLIELQSGHMLYYHGTSNGRTSGVGFIIHRRLKHLIVKCDSSSDRVARVQIKINKRYTLQIVQVYAPTSAYKDDVIEAFYEEVTDLHENSNAHYKIVMGDFNAQVGMKQQGDQMVGEFGIGSRNSRGDRLVEFAEAKLLYVANTMFQKNPTRKWTWQSPNNNKHEIDFVLTNRRQALQDCTVLNRFDAGSDHRLVRCRMAFDSKLERQKLIKNSGNGINLDALKLNQDSFHLELRNRFASIQNFNDADVIIDTIKGAARKAGGKPVRKIDCKISEETKELQARRREMKASLRTRRQKSDYAEISKITKKRIREDIRQYNYNLTLRTIEENRSQKKARRQLIVGKYQIVAIKSESGDRVDNRDDILKVVQKFYQQLYQDDRSRVNIEVGEEIPHVLPIEVKHALNSMKCGTAPGEDGITVDLLKIAGNEIYSVLAKLYTSCLQNKKIPTSWNNATIILIHKKGDKEDLKNYRPISLVSVAYKILTKIITNRLSARFDEFQPREQAGFRKSFSTIDHIFTLRELISRCQEYNLPLCCAFVDYEKAFDSVKTSAVVESLLKVGIPSTYTELIQNIYHSATSTVRLHAETDKFPIQKGVRQGDTISPKLFTAALESMFQTLDWSNKGININGQHLHHLRFADDIVLFAHTIEELQDLMTELNTSSKEVGLKMNIGKTKIAFNSSAIPGDIFIGNTRLEVVESYLYLGQLITMNGDIAPEIARRTKLAWCTVGRLNSVFKSKMPLCMKRRVFDQCVLPVMTYACETWTLKTSNIQRLQTTQRSIERYMMNLTIRDKKRCEWIRSQTKVRDVVETIKRSKWKWAGHLARLKDDRWTSVISDWEPRGVLRPRKRPNDRWDREIRKHRGITWKRDAQHRENWRTLGEAFVQQWM